MISDQNAKGRFDKFVLKMRISKMHYKFCLENVYTQNADSPNCLEAKEENPDGKVFIYLFI